MIIGCPLDYEGMLTGSSQDAPLTLFGSSLGTHGLPLGFSWDGIGFAQDNAFSLEVSLDVYGAHGTLHFLWQLFHAFDVILVTCSHN